MSSSFRAPRYLPLTKLISMSSAVPSGDKKLILSVTALIGLAASAYALLATPEYQVASVLRPAAVNELDALNRSGIYNLPPREALMKVGLHWSHMTSVSGSSEQTSDYLKSLNGQVVLWSRVLRRSIETP